MLIGKLAEIEREVERLMQAIVAGGDLSSLVAALKTREHRREELHQRLTSLEQRSRLSDLDVRRLKQRAQGRLTDWQGLLGRQPEQARQILSKPPLWCGAVTTSAFSEAPPALWASMMASAVHAPRRRS